MKYNQETDTYKRIRSMQADLLAHNRTKLVLMEQYIKDRLEASVERYRKDLDIKLNKLSSIDSLRILRNIDKEV